jgi:hypothetical protein
MERVVQHVHDIVDYGPYTGMGWDKDRFWHVRDTGIALMHTAKTMEALSFLALMAQVDGVVVEVDSRLDLDRCDYCGALLPMSVLNEAGPTDAEGYMIATIAYCDFCEKEG